MTINAGAEAYLGGALGHAPPLWQIFFVILKKLENLVCPPLCEH